MILIKKSVNCYYGEEKIGFINKPNYCVLLFSGGETSNYNPLSPVSHDPLKLFNPIPIYYFVFTPF